MQSAVEADLQQLQWLLAIRRRLDTSIDTTEIAKEIGARVREVVSVTALERLSRRNPTLLLIVSTNRRFGGRGGFGAGHCWPVVRTLCRLDTLKWTGSSFPLPRLERLSRRNPTLLLIVSRRCSALCQSLRRCRPRTLSSSHFENLIWPLPISGRRRASFRDAASRRVPSSERRAVCARRR
jgi:hypothetical protein